MNYCNGRLVLSLEDDGLTEDDIILSQTHQYNEQYKITLNVLMKYVILPYWFNLICINGGSENWKILNVVS